MGGEREELGIDVLLTDDLVSVLNSKDIITWEDVKWINEWINRNLSVLNKTKIEQYIRNQEPWKNAGTKKWMTSQTRVKIN